MLQMVGVFAQFERATIQQRINAGLSVLKEKLARDGKFEMRGGKVRTRLGRPGAKPEKIEAARQEHAKGTGIGKTARLTGLGTGTVHKLAREMRAMA
jgi:DNA invertase Pin-like site-specific DNA recombinase